MILIESKSKIQLRITIIDLKFKEYSNLWETLLKIMLINSKIFKFQHQHK
jgi:hypothetical protein